MEEILDSPVLVQHIWGTFSLVALKVNLRSFGALSIFRNLGLMIRGRRKYFEWLLQINCERYKNEFPLYFWHFLLRWRLRSCVVEAIGDLQYTRGGGLKMEDFSIIIKNLTL